MNEIRSRGAKEGRKEGRKEGPWANFVSWNFEFTLHVAPPPPVSYKKIIILLYLCYIVSGLLILAFPRREYFAL